MDKQRASRRGPLLFAARILLKRGYKTDQTEAKWLESVSAVDIDDDPASQQQFLRMMEELVRRHWEPASTIDEDAYKDVLEWASRGPYPWHKALCDELGVPMQ